jgi:hypothetical protein
MVTRVIYARLFNLGNYENERLEVEVVVESGDYVAAFDEARATVEAQQAQFQTERAAAEQARREAWEAERNKKNEPF